MYCFVMAVLLTGSSCIKSVQIVGTLGAAHCDPIDGAVHISLGQNIWLLLVKNTCICQFLV